MAKLGLAIAAATWALVSTPASAAPPVSAEETLAAQRSSLRSSIGVDCDRGAGEIVVCGRTGPDPDRLPLPVRPEPGARKAGEPPDPSRALALSRQRCTTVGRDQQCSGGLPVIPIAFWLVRTTAKAIKGRE